MVIMQFFDNLLSTQFIILIFDHLCGPQKKKLQKKKNPYLVVIKKKK
jgi:hypothetical protein